MRTAAIALALATVLAHGQTAKLGATAPKLTFPAIDELDRRENFARIRQQALFQGQAHQQRLKEANAVFAAMGRLPKTKSVDERILSGIKIRRDLVVTLDGIREDRDRCLRILELVAEAAREENLPNDARHYLKDIRDTATNMRRFQLLQNRRLQSASIGLKNTMRRIPAPGTFENHLGLNMVLVRQKKTSFYISREPVPAGKLAEALGNQAGKPPLTPNWHQARHFCRWLSQGASAPYYLPTLDQMKTFTGLGGKVTRPVWTQDLHRPKKLAERRMRSRFGVETVVLFDPAGILGNQAEHEEMPFASYPEMSFYVVTPVETGWWLRWNTLKQTLDK
ncbi:MAG: hypothetical protein HN849_17485 [Victivallales bacterium]|jgi:hypothetical protein|nr:hypothetical protein [Victivallales bacterium]MBT7166825.1 hypothetical protein [Victivallales bacterium]MBT7301319.1 hypothetical protein [Victivallales bacterium]